ncbi:MAG TPA: hypothetical protein VE177_05990, partial [Candidatus Binatus sp.]|nr:hypothetical protein [Candidatus Binatus sp.]
GRTPYIVAVGVCETWTVIPQPGAEPVGFAPERYSRRKPDGVTWILLRLKLLIALNSFSIIASTLR